MPDRTGATCPRCGYDLRGVIEGWGESCPLHGVCAECGLGFEWAELLSDKRRLPRWCVEYAAQGRRVPLAAITTLGMTFWPWGFWRAVQMFHPPRWQRLAAYLGVLLALIYLTGALCHGAVAGQVWWAYVSGSSVRVQIPQPRGVTFGLYLDYTTSASPWLTVAQAVLLPFSGQSPGTMTPVPGGPIARTGRRWAPAGTPPATVPHPSPRHVLALYYADPVYTAYPARGSRSRGFSLGNYGAAELVMLFAYPALLVVVSPGWFLLLPFSRRQAKVRWSHLVRIALYSTAFLAVLGCASIVLNVMSYMTRSPVRGVFQSIALLCMVVFPAVLFVWWSVATSGYLRMRHPWGVGLAVVGLSNLLLLACGYLVQITEFWVLM